MTEDKQRQVSLERYCDQVRITIRCANRYEAIVLYEDIIERGQTDGNVSIEFKGTNLPAPIE